MRRSRIPQLRNFALTPLDIAVRLDGKTGRQDWTARLDRNTGRQDWTAILDGKTGRQYWTARLDGKTGPQYWTARLDGKTGPQYWTAILDGNTGIDGEHDHNILRQYILYSRRRSNLTAILSGVSARLCRCGMPALPE
jgi:hypothetical protein